MNNAAESSPLLERGEGGDNDNVDSKGGCPQFPGRRERHQRSKSRPRLIGAVMFALAFAGLVAIFNAIQESETSTPSSSNLQEIPRESGLSFRPPEEKRQETRTDGRADETESHQTDNKAGTDYFCNHWHMFCFLGYFQFRQACITVDLHKSTPNRRHWEFHFNHVGTVFFS